MSLPTSVTTVQKLQKSLHVKAKTEPSYRFYSLWDKIYREDVLREAYGRLKRYGCKRIAIVHERSDLTDTPRFLVSDAVHWESGRIIETWSFRWAAEVFHEFSKQGTGLEAAQVRNEEAVKRHLRLSCLAQSILQRAPTVASTSEHFALAKGTITFGQRCRTITREVFHSLLAFAQRLFAGGYSCEQVVEALMPA